MDTARRIEATILELLRKRTPESTICPSEVARAVQPRGWRALMPEVRRVARDLAAHGRLRLTQRGVELDPLEDPHGPIRLALPGTAGSKPAAGSGGGGGNRTPVRKS